MMIRYATLAVVLTVSLGAQSASTPETPAGQVLAAWLDAFNSADPVKMLAFGTTYRIQSGPPIAQQIRFREETGGFTLVRIEKSEPTSIVALLQEKDSDTLARIEMVVTGDPPKLKGPTPIRSIERPADLAIARITEAAALAALSARVDELASRDKFSGVVLVARHGTVLLQKAAGTANREAGTLITADTKFRNGSMNKMFTATAILQLVDAGKLALDDPIGQHLTEYPNADVATKVTVRHLLTHSGGTGDIFGPEFTKHRLTLREHADYVKLYGSRGLGHEPGAEFRYSNYGFVLLGAIIEKVTGVSYYDYVRTKVFAPAGMTSTGSLPEAESVPNRSSGYMRSAGQWLPNTDTLPWRGTSAGGGYATAGDFFRFARALESGTLVSKALLAEATKVQRDRYGFGFGISGEGALRAYGHGGGAPGMNGDLRVFPALGYVVVALSNLDPPAASRLADFFTLRMPLATPGSSALHQNGER